MFPTGQAEAEAVAAAHRAHVAVLEAKAELSTQIERKSLSKLAEAVAKSELKMCSEALTVAARRAAEASARLQRTDATAQVELAAGKAKVTAEAEAERAQAELQTALRAKCNAKAAVRTASALASAKGSEMAAMHTSLVEASETTKMHAFQLKLVEMVEQSATVYATRMYDGALQLQNTEQGESAAVEANQAAKDWVEQQEAKTLALHTLTLSERDTELTKIEILASEQAQAARALVDAGNPRHPTLLAGPLISRAPTLPSPLL
jgi:hypothetical protein